MTESRESASSASSDPFTDSGASDESDSLNDLTSTIGPQVSLTVDMARMWVREHQKASMLGAFAMGVFTGAWLRD